MTESTQLPKPLRGIIPPMITPLCDRDTLDIPGLERLVEHILGGQVQGLFILGTTGEGPSLGYRLRCELIDRVCEQVASRVPVLVGITDTAFTESVNLAHHAADAGASAVVLSAPYYSPAAQPELMEYLANITAELPLPLFLYNMPSHTKVNFSLELLRGAMDLPGIVGLKDSSCNMIYFHRALRMIRRHRPEWSVLVGPEELLAEAVLLGADGGVNGGANLCPQLYVELFHAAAAHDVDRVIQLHEQVMELAENLYHVGQHGSAVIKGLKCALSCLGVCDDFMAEPFRRFRALDREKVREALSTLNLSSPALPN